MIPDTSSKIIFTPIKSKRTFEEISFEIKRLIFKGILKPNDKLPSEIELARQFNVGRQTIREALRLLELSGFISIQKGSTGGPIIEDTIFNTISNSFLDVHLSLSYVSCMLSGMQRTWPTVVTKLVSPAQRGTTCM